MHIFDDVFVTASAVLLEDTAAAMIPDRDSCVLLAVSREKDTPEFWASLANFPRLRCVEPRDHKPSAPRHSQRHHDGIRLGWKERSPIDVASVARLLRRFWQSRRPGTIRVTLDSQLAGAAEIGLAKHTVRFRVNKILEQSCSVGCWPSFLSSFAVAKRWLAVDVLPG